MRVVLVVLAAGDTQRPPTDRGPRVSALHATCAWPAALCCLAVCPRVCDRPYDSCCFRFGVPDEMRARSTPPQGACLCVYRTRLRKRPRPQPLPSADLEEAGRGVAVAGCGWSACQRASRECWPCCRTCRERDVVPSKHRRRNMSCILQDSRRHSQRLLSYIDAAERDTVIRQPE